MHPDQLKLNINKPFLVLRKPPQSFYLTMSEEIIFRVILLPKMKGAFGRADWMVNGVLFALYHFDKPWD